MNFKTNHVVKTKSQICGYTTKIYKDNFMELFLLLFIFYDVNCNIEILKQT